MKKLALNKAIIFLDVIWNRVANNNNITHAHYWKNILDIIEQEDIEDSVPLLIIRNKLLCGSETSDENHK